jgi:hypothetical protein
LVPRRCGRVRDLVNGNFVRYEDPTYTAYVQRVRDTADAFADPHGSMERQSREDRLDDYAPSPRWERLAALVQPAGPGLTPAHEHPSLDASQPPSRGASIPLAPLSVGRSHGGEG